MDKLANLIHVGKRKHGRTTQFIFLRKMSPSLFTWFEEANDTERATAVSASQIEEAIRLAYRQWQKEHFSLLKCGFRYMLPERDEHGINALFYQMVASVSSPTGIYFDDRLGNNCFVQNASIEARNLWKKLAEQKNVQ